MFSIFGNIRSITVYYVLDWIKIDRLLQVSECYLNSTYYMFYLMLFILLKSLKFISSNTWYIFIYIYSMHWFTDIRTYRC